VFGDDILDTSISTEKAIGFFMGTGYALFNTYQSPDTPNGKKFTILNHQLG
jgi:hypothetical protein